MIRNILRVIVVVLGSRLASPQDSVPLTTQDVISAALADLRGLGEAIERSGPEGRSDLSALWFSIVNSPMAPPARLDSARLPPSERPSAGTLSVKRLQYRAPKAAREAYEKANRLSRKKDLDKAVRELEKAIAIDSDFAAAHCNLGVVYARLGRYAEAEAEMRRAIEMLPDESLPHSNLAWLLFATGQPGGAQASVRRALQLAPDNAAAHMLIARLLIQTPETLAEGRWHLEYAARSIPEAKRMLKVINKK